MTIYTSKKTGATYTIKNLENGKFELTSTEDSTDIITTTESVLKRWYKKSVVVDFTNAEDKPEEENTEETSDEDNKPSKKTSKKSGKKQSKPHAKTYEEQKWGLEHTRMSLETFCELFGISELEIEYDSNTQEIHIKAGEKPCVRRAWHNELTGSVWFRFKNAEYELTDVDYVA